MNDIITSFQDFILDIISLVLGPPYNALDSLGIDLKTITISPGIGQSTWFTLDLYTLIIIFVTLLSTYLIVKVTYKMIKKLFKTILGAFRL